MVLDLEEGTIHRSLGAQSCWLPAEKGKNSGWGGVGGSTRSSFMRLRGAWGCLLKGNLGDG